MKSYLEKVKLNAILAGELNKFEGIDARIVGAHSVLATYKGVDVCVEVISTDKIRCTRVSDGLSHERRSFRCVVAKCNCVRGIGFFGVPICVKE